MRPRAQVAAGRHEDDDVDVVEVRRGQGDMLELDGVVERERAAAEDDLESATRPVRRDGGWRHGPVESQSEDFVAFGSSRVMGTPSQ